MILAAAVRADAAIAGEVAVGGAVLDGAEIGGELLEAGDAIVPVGPRVERVAIGDGEEHRDDERRRAAHPGGARQIAGDRDVAAVERRREVADDAAHDGRRVVVPVRARRLIERQLEARLGAVHDVDHGDDRVLARRHRHHEAAFGGAEQAASAGVVGVLAEHLDAARHPVAARRAADAAGIEHGPRGRQQARLALGFFRAQARRRQLVAQVPHGSTVTPGQRALHRGDVAAPGQVEDAVLGDDDLEADAAADAAR